MTDYMFSPMDCMDFALILFLKFFKSREDKDLGAMSHIIGQNERFVRKHSRAFFETARLASCH